MTRPRPGGQKQAMAKNMLNILVLSIPMVAQENAAKQSTFSSRESFDVGFLVRGGSCLRGGGETVAVNLTEKVFSVLQMREAAMSAMKRNYNFSDRPMTVPCSLNITVKIDG